MADTVTNMVSGMMNVARIKTEVFVSKANEESNRSFDEYLDELYSEQVKQKDTSYMERESNYNSDINSYNLYQNIVNKHSQAHSEYEMLSRKADRTQAETDRMNDLQKDENAYQTANNRANSYKQKIDYFEQQVATTERYTFTNEEEYRTFVANAEAQGIVGSASMEQYNNMYVFETAKENNHRVSALCNSLDIDANKDNYHRSVMKQHQQENLYNVYSGTTNSTTMWGVWWNEALRETDEFNQILRKSQRAYDLLNDETLFANPFDKHETLEKVDTAYNVFATNNSNNALVMEARKVAKAHGTDEMTGFAYAFTNKYQANLPLTSKGLVDVDAFEKMSEMQLKRLGISKEEHKLAISVLKEANKDASILTPFKRPMKALGYKVVEITEDEDINNLVGYSSKTVKTGQDVAQIVRRSKDMEVRDALSRLRRKNALKNGTIKRPTISTTSTTVKKKTVQTTSASLRKQQSELANKTFKRLDKRKRLARRWGKSAVGKGASVLKKGQSALKGAKGIKAIGEAIAGFASGNIVSGIKGTIQALWEMKEAIPFILVGAFMPFLIMIGGVIMVVVIITTIPSFFETETEDTVIYTLYEHLNELEADWVASLEDTEGLYNQREDLMYLANTDVSGIQIQSYEDYIENHNNMYLDGNDLYVTPFDFEPADLDAYAKKVTEYDGGSIITYAPNFSMGYYENYNGGHTSNTKDIICMLDVMFQFDVDNSDDNALNDLTGNTVLYIFDDYFTEAKNNLKLIGACISTLWDENALLEYSQEYKPDVTFNNLQIYCDTLFGASHQEAFSLTPLFFNVNGSGERIDTEEGIHQDDIYAGTQLIEECPNFADGGCQTATFYCFYDGSAYPRIGCEDVNGTMQSVSSGTNSIVQLDGSMCLHSSLFYATTVTDAMVDWARNHSECWDITENTTNQGTVTSTSVPSDACNVVTNNLVANSPSSSYQMKHIWYTFENHRYTTHSCTRGGCIYQNVPHTVLVCMNPFHGHDASCYDTDYRWECVKTTDYVFDRIRHEVICDWSCDTCDGHEGSYCGGHIAVDATGVVFSFTDDQIQYVLGNENANEIIPKCDGIDYSSFSSAITSCNEELLGNRYYQEATYNITGLNLIGTTGWDSGTPEVPSTDIPEESGDVGAFSDYQITIMTHCTDIFDIDHNIKYGWGFFPYRFYTDYEGWTADNMQLALLKYTQSWGDIYEFDIPINLGMPQLSETEIDNIIDGVVAHYQGLGIELSEERIDALRSALQSVGNGQYSQEHHAHGYLLYNCTQNVSFEDTQHLCTCTDCSGYASWHLLSNHSPTMPNDTEVLTTDGFLGLANGVNWNGNNALPSDVLIKHGADDSSGVGGNHALIFVGYLDEDIELSFGTLHAGIPITIDCTRQDHKGNVYLRNGGLDAENGGVTPCGYITNLGAGNDVWLVPFE